jgi:hypothetical protein
MKETLGPEIDWLIHSWIGNSPLGFTNMHVTVWLGPHIDVPRGLLIERVPC